MAHTKTFIVLLLLPGLLFDPAALHAVRPAGSMRASLSTQSVYQEQALMGSLQFAWSIIAQSHIGFQARVQADAARKRQAFENTSEEGTRRTRWVVAGFFAAVGASAYVFSVMEARRQTLWEMGREDSGLLWDLAAFFAEKIWEIGIYPVLLAAGAVGLYRIGRMVLSEDRHIVLFERVLDILRKPMADRAARKADEERQKVLVNVERGNTPMSDWPVETLLYKATSESGLTIASKRDALLWVLEKKRNLGNGSLKMRHAELLEIITAIRPITERPADPNSNEKKNSLGLAEAAVRILVRDGAAEDLMKLLSDDSFFRLGKRTFYKDLLVTIRKEFDVFERLENEIVRQVLEAISSPLPPPEKIERVGWSRATEKAPPPWYFEMQKLLFTENVPDLGLEITEPAVVAKPTRRPRKPLPLPSRVVPVLEASEDDVRMILARYWTGDPSDLSLLAGDVAKVLREGQELSAVLSVLRERGLRLSKTVQQDFIRQFQWRVPKQAKPKPAPVVEFASDDDVSDEERPKKPAEEKTPVAARPGAAGFTGYFTIFDAALVLTALFTAMPDAELPDQTPMLTSLYYWIINLGGFVILGGVLKFIGWIYSGMTKLLAPREKRAREISPNLNSRSA